MSAINVSLTPGYQFSANEELTYAKLNQLGTPAVGIGGQISTAQLAAQSVTQSILALGAVGAPQCVTNGFTGDATGAAPFVAPGAGVTGFLSNLYLQQSARPVAGRTKCLCYNNTTTPATQLTCTAAELVLNDASGNYYLATSVNVTAAITSSGLNGLDTGTVATNTWYYMYVIWNGATLGSLISASATAPTLPSSYTYFQLVGAVFNQNSGGFQYFRAVNRRVFVAGVETSTAAALTTSYAALSLAPASPAVQGVPPIATMAYGNFKASSTYTVLVAGDANGTGADAALGNVNAGAFAVALATASTVYVKGSSASATLALSVTGYEF